MGIFLGIDTSNYTTSVSLVKDGEVLSNLKLPVFVKAGERGTRQSDAVFSHTKNLPELFIKLGKENPDAIGVSVRPRDVEGSYMPCFLAGKSVANSLASITGIPCYEFSHQAGHIRAAIYSSERKELINSKFIGFHISGGTTEVLLYDNGKIDCVGGSADINAGQLIDRVGVMLGLKFPCGAELEKLCDFELLKNLKEEKKIYPMTTVRGLECNLSGLENKAAGFIENGISRELVAAFVIASVEKTLSKLAQNAIEKFGKMPILFSGGVCSNKHLNRELSLKFPDSSFASPEFSSDNACGIALLCEERYNKENGR